MLSEKVLASIKSITGLSLEEMKKMDIYHEIEYVQKKTGKKLVFSSQPDARRIGRGDPLIARHRFRTIEEVDKRILKNKK